MTIQFILLLILLLIEVLTLVTNIVGVLQSMPPSIRMIRGIFVYTLYYTVCIYGPLDLAKTTLLRKNQKMGGYFLCLMIACQTLIQAMFFDNLIILLLPRRDDINSVEWHILKVLEVLTSLLACICMLDMLKRELRELKSI